MAAASPPPWSRARLHVVTGKGGTGKTTVAAALALALAHGGRRVLLVEVEGRQGISQTLDVPPLPVTETRVAHAPGGGEVVGLSVDAKAALLEYLQIFYKLGRAGGVLERFGAIDFATTIAPGVRDVLLVGKVYEANRRRRDGRRSDPVPGEMAYDALVLDAPPTGRIGRFLSVNEEVADLARMGPIHSQAESITQMLRSGQSVVHLVTLLEDMPVQETADAVAELEAARMPVGALVVNQVRPAVLGARPLRAAAKGTLDRDAVASGLGAAGLDAGEATLDGLLTEAGEHARRVAQESELQGRVDALGKPVVRLPSLSDGVDAAAVRELADLLREQGMVA
ncbi:ArsA-related P-loop ATPase [Lapillicoccus jejuensis]|uniref:Arsenite efflux ATP-binding protein ArsA n=1 Tax=Lapillicoccus jejuensis TaxID=402171 RepID=A0A542DXV3_9MICO|nr:ArsA-related P-loop ATPase [Lapillicoccus jejuensis]TQJ07918.1 arsenite efflux ATP-binding protein ArsA [Lapillicoccus jejuensis]